MLGKLATGTSAFGKHAGLTPRIFEHLLGEMQRRGSQHRDEGSVRFQCHVSMLEIYNETITDLLNPEATNLMIREDVQHGIHVEGLSHEPVLTGADAATWACV